MLNLFHKIKILIVSTVTAVTGFVLPVKPTVQPVVLPQDQVPIVATMKEVKTQSAKPKPVIVKAKSAKPTPKPVVQNSVPQSNVEQVITAPVVSSPVQSQTPAPPPLVPAPQNTQPKIPNCASNATLCNNECGSSCPQGQQFECQETGGTCLSNPAINIIQKEETMFCNGKNWLRCDTNQNFVCPSQGDPYCSTNTSNAVSRNQGPTSFSDAGSSVGPQFQFFIEQQNNAYEKYLVEQQEINEKKKPLDEEFKRIYSEQEKNCPMAFFAGQKEVECRNYSFQLMAINRKIAEITGIYPDILTLPHYQLPRYEEWRIDTNPGGVDGKIWSSSTNIQYRYECLTPLNCKIYSY